MQEVQAMQEVQEGKEESDLATIRAWRGKWTDGRMVKQHLTAPQYVMWADLKRRVNSAAHCKPSMENDARQARLIRGLRRLTVLAEVRQGKFYEQTIVQAAVRLPGKQSARPN